MTIQAHVVTGLYTGYIADGLESIATEVRHVMVNLVGGGLYANKTGIEYAMWPASTLGVLGAPTLKANDGTTDALGQFVLSTSGVFSPGTELIFAVRKPAGGGGGDDDEWGIGAVTVSSA